MECTCPTHAPHPEYCLDCPVHGQAAAAACEAEAVAEQAAEGAWLRAAEYDPRMDDPREW